MDSGAGGAEYVMFRCMLSRDSGPGNNSPPDVLCIKIVILLRSKCSPVPYVPVCPR